MRDPRIGAGGLPVRCQIRGDLARDEQKQVARNALDERVVPLPRAVAERGVGGNALFLFSRPNDRERRAVVAVAPHPLRVERQINVQVRVEVFQAVPLLETPVRLPRHGLQTRQFYRVGEKDLRLLLRAVDDELPADQSGERRPDAFRVVPVRFLRRFADVLRPVAAPRVGRRVQRQKPHAGADGLNQFFLRPGRHGIARAVRIADVQVAARVQNDRAELRQVLAEDVSVLGAKDVKAVFLAELPKKRPAFAGLAVVVPGRVVDVAGTVVVVQDFLSALLRQQWSAKRQRAGKGRPLQKISPFHISQN